MERVKPIYLSRTYGIPLLDESEPTRSWQPEDFLDKLARMKGRLLKQGEPDLDGVAKIVLSDWVRGRIPYFVPPPERSEELNKTEEKKMKMNLKAKGKAVDEEVSGVMQNLKSLVQKNVFIPEDIQQLDAGFEGNGEVEVEQNNLVEDVEDQDDFETEDVELKWADVFDGINLNPVASEAVNTKVGDDGMSRLNILLSIKNLCSADSEDSRTSPQKETRMKTGKVRKAPVLKIFF